MKSTPEKSDLVASLHDLAMDLHWSWNHATDKIWRQLDPVLWGLTHNPLVVLQTVSQDRIHQVLDDPLVRDVVEELVEVKRQMILSPAWFHNQYTDAHLKPVAFFSMEFMLSEALPVYSGGLGNVAGDLLKTASDLGVPMVGVGLLYQQGYPRQVIYKDGTQLYLAPYNDPGQLPISPLRYPNGEWLRIEIELPGYSLWLRAWEVKVGRVKLFLLDTNDAANFPTYRGITGQLYGGDAEVRILQELVLGIGGWRLLKALGMEPEVCHLNEGHSAFVIMERCRSFMIENKVSFPEALQITRAGNIFTTHTAVDAGFDLFTPSLVARYLGNYISKELGIGFRDFMAMGRKNDSDEQELFNTGFFAIRGSGHVNGVSSLHGRVSRKLFASLFPRWPVAEVPIGHVTNGVHVPTWDSPEFDKLWTETCGKERWLGGTESLSQNIWTLTDERLWKARLAGKGNFIDYIRQRFARQLATTGSTPQQVEAAAHLFDPDKLTFGFARRFASYKRPNLLLSDPDRLYRILSNEKYPVQLVLAGKAHYGDNNGQEMIRAWMKFIQDRGLQNKVVFLSDYDMMLTEQMVQGVDLWINTPRRPWEACGTSGMKVLVNGGINLSELDGWWDKAYSPDVGWAIGDRNDHGDDAYWDMKEAQHLYDLLENEVIPEYYDRNSEGISQKWVHRMRHSMAELTGRFSSNRSLQEYLGSYYLKAAAAYQARSENKGEWGRQFNVWKQAFMEKWKGLYFDHVRIETGNGQHRFTVTIFLNGISPGDIAVELYAEGEKDGLPFRQIMEAVNDPGNEGKQTYTISLPDNRPSSDHTPRIIPVHPDIYIPLELGLILWQH